ncbi:response regulator [Lentilitoribacter sp. Alg239-R112]|uniref:response regulator n=1 Tax=Lentilitoribacter sp. Alg239-R112 TaxID=2305987 RepID=UPI0013A6C9E9|nr:response regulator [Lentilitoribacter sp. Alg239-R112]
MTKHIMIVEDEEALAEVLKDYLARNDMRATILLDGHNAVKRILEEAPDLVILDVMLPGEDGLSICRKVRDRSDVPIILETARVEEIDRLLGLELGADDYICKPWSPREVVARVKAILRRTSRSNDVDESVSEEGGLQLNEENWSVSFDNQLLDFTRREFQLLSILYKRPGRVFSRAQLLELAFPDDAMVFDRTVDSHIKNIRQKLKPHSQDGEIIRSVYGVGYAYDG